MVLNRLVAPKSEHAMPDWIRSTAIGNLLGVDFTALVDDPLYRKLDRLHPHRTVIETELVRRERNLFNLDPTLFFYDLTSTYFEGQALSNPKARRGYSRDKRPDCKQVVVGLALGLSSLGSHRDDLAASRSSHVMGNGAGRVIDP